LIKPIPFAKHVQHFVFYPPSPSGNHRPVAGDIISRGKLDNDEAQDGYQDDEGDGEQYPSQYIGEHSHLLLSYSKYKTSPERQWCSYFPDLFKINKYY
jgi:hypothetical protein